MKLVRRPAQSTEPEWMDAPGHSRELIANNLRDLRRVNWLLGGVRLTLIPLRRLLGPAPVVREERVLDVATGGADIPRAILSWSRASGRLIKVVATDVSHDFLCVAREYPGGAGLSYAVADARNLPFGDATFDVVASSLALHHMLRDEARAMLAEARRCASQGVIVNDIVRGWIGYVGAFIATRLGSRNVLTWHDGPLSVLRAFTRGEMEELAHEAGLRPIRWDSFLFYRVAMTAVPEPASQVVVA